MSYTIKNLRETEDKAPEFGFAETQESHFPAGELGAEATGMAFHVIRPGRRQAFAHRHEQAEEIYVVLSGRGKIKLDGETLEVAPIKGKQACRTSLEGAAQNQGIVGPSSGEAPVRRLVKESPRLGLSQRDDCGLVLERPGEEIEGIGRRKAMRCR